MAEAVEHVVRNTMSTDYSVQYTLGNKVLHLIPPEDMDDPLMKFFRIRCVDGSQDCTAALFGRLKVFYKKQAMQYAWQWLTGHSIPVDAL